MKVLGLAFAVIGTLMPTLASASDFRLRVEDLSVPGSPSGYGVVVTDNGDGDEDSQAGMIKVTLMPLTENGVQWSLTFGISKPVFPYADSGILGELYLTSFNMTTSGAAKVRLTLEDTGFVSPAPNAPLELKTSISGSFCGGIPGVGGSSCDGSLAELKTTSFAVDGDAVPDLGPDQSSVGTLQAVDGYAGTQTPEMSFQSTSALAQDFSNDSYATFEDTGTNYSLFTRVLLDFSGAGDISFTQSTTTSVASGELSSPTPEPASLMLITTGIAGLAGARRRQKQRRA